MVDKHTPAREARRASMSPGGASVAPGFLCCFPWCRGEVVFDVDAFGDVVGREDDDSVAGELAAVGGEDFGRRLRYVDGRFAIFDFWLGLLYFQRFGDVGEVFI